MIFAGLFAVEIGFESMDFLGLFSYFSTTYPARNQMRISDIAGGGTAIPRRPSAHLRSACLRFKGGWSQICGLWKSFFHRPVDFPGARRDLEKLLCLCNSNHNPGRPSRSFNVTGAAEILHPALQRLSAKSCLGFDLAIVDRMPTEYQTDAVALARLPQNEPSIKPYGLAHPRIMLGLKKAAAQSRVEVILSQFSSLSPLGLAKAVR
ncbi:MAG: hypothetical protein WBE20_12850 [Candidatus Acidiferrales bacterium]